MPGLFTNDGAPKSCRQNKSIYFMPLQILALVLNGHPWCLKTKSLRFIIFLRIKTSQKSEKIFAARSHLAWQYVLAANESQSAGKISADKTTQQH